MNDEKHHEEIANRFSIAETPLGFVVEYYNPNYDLRVQVMDGNRVYYDNRAEAEAVAQYRIWRTIRSRAN